MKSLKYISKKIKQFNNYCVFIEKERVNAMIYCGRGW
jgi:sRNA-binding regulator protein Hfq